MTIKKLLTLAAAVLCAGSMWAQKDVTSTYITNAKLSDGTNGWTKNFTKTTPTDDPADAFSKSVQGNNTEGYATEAYAGWGSLIQTAYSMKQTITLPAGNYRLVCYAFYRQGQAYNTNASKSLAILKAGDQWVALKTLGSITAAGYANTQAEGANCFDSKMYRNVVEFTSDGSSIEIGVEGTFDEAKCWCIVGQFELFDLNDLASASSPTDVTYAITNSGFEYRNLSGWTNSVTVGNNHYASDDHIDPYRAGLGYYETWTSSANGGKLGNAGTFTQTLENMPAGLYELSVYAQNIEQGNGNAGGTGMYLTANGDQTVIGTAGQYKVRTTLAADGDLVIGVKFDDCSGNWAAFDRFGLQFYGDPLEAYKDLLAGKVTEAQTLHDSGNLPSAAASALQTVISANDNDDDAFTTEAEFNTAIENIEAGMTTANTFVTPYAAFNALKAKADILVAVANDNATANSTLSDAISTQNTAAEAATTVANVEAATSALKTAMQTYVFAATPVGDGAKFDCTFLMDNPDLTDFAAWTSVDDVDGWYSDYTDGNRNVQHSAGVASSHGDAFFEYWSATAKADNKFAFYQLVNLPEGTYQIQCDALATANGVEGATNSAVYFFANDTQGSLISSDVLTAASISFVNSTTQDVKIGLKACTGNEFRWMGIGYVELYKVPAQTYTIDETAEYDNTQSGAGDVTLNRTISAGLNTLVLPFSMTQAEVESTFGAGSKVYVVSAYDEGKENITFAEQSGIQPNVPCLLEATVAGTSYTIEGRTIVAGTPTVSVTGLDFIGTYTPGTVPMDSYVISGSNIYKVDSNVSIKSTRAYFTVTATGAAPSRLTWSFDEADATAIDEIVNGQSVNGQSIYNLNGQQLNSLQRGINIVGGKKVLVK
ncbi:MAG: hypothetical protein IJ528_04935 [Bacteroidaceae bacterium]|nr:hypothetical protein [Bacteroidaceae bacterium]